MMEISGILLVAGMSARMGQLKQLLLLPFGYDTIIEVVILAGLPIG